MSRPLGVAMQSGPESQSGGKPLEQLVPQENNASPLITVVTAVFNAALPLESTIQSVLAQTYGNVEYIVIDGGSSDGTLDVIRKYEHGIDHWLSEPDKGVYDAFNKSLPVHPWQMDYIPQRRRHALRPRGARQHRRGGPTAGNETEIVYGRVALTNDATAPR